MRVAEAVHVAAFSFFFLVLAFQWTALPAARRRRVLLLGSGGLAVTLGGLFTPAPVRDWIPAALMLVVYQQAGAFFIRVDRPFQAALLELDARWAAPILRALARGGPVGLMVVFWCELSYLLCYAVIPLSLGALYALDLSDRTDFFWGVVLISTYGCYAMLPFIQTMPPRVLGEPWVPTLRASAVRRLNLWLLRNASIHANTFPSAHAAAAVSAALVLLAVAPAAVGAGFAVLALGITAGTFVGRYHYLSDALLGLAYAVGVFAAAVIGIR
jgi:hypothetical protein